MSQAALKLAGAGLEQTEPGFSEAETGFAVQEARRLGELAGEFCLFGLNIALDVGDLSESADHAYRADDVAPEPANDTQPTPASFAFPTLNRRGVHIHSALPVRTMQALDWVFIVVAAELAARWGAGVGLADL